MKDCGEDLKFEEIVIEEIDDENIKSDGDASKKDNRNIKPDESATEVVPEAPSDTVTETISIGTEGDSTETEQDKTENAAAKTEHDKAENVAIETSDDYEEIRVKSSIGNIIVNFMFIVLLIFGLSILLISYYNNKRGIDNYYTDASERLTSMLAISQEGDYIANLIKIIETDEFQSIRDKALKDSDNNPIAKYLMDKGMYSQYISLCDWLRELKAGELEVERIDIYTRNGNTLTYIVSDLGDLQTLGLIVDASDSDMYDKDHFHDGGESVNDSGNTHIDSYIVKESDNEAYSYGFYPIRDSEGNSVATLNLVLDMNDVYKSQDNYLIAMIIIITFLTSIIAIVGIFWLRENAIIPIEQITKSVRKFENNGEGYYKDNILEYDINTGNELEDLYNSVNSMQKHMVDYLDNLNESTAERERMGLEVSIATKIQSGLLEKIEPNYVGKQEYDVYATMDSAKEVGGDLYDLFMVDEDHLAFVIADVSGKGVGAAFMMAIAKTLIKTYAQLGQHPAEIIKNVDRRIAAKNEATLFVTVWLGIVNLNTGHVVSCNAGHDYPLIMHEDEGFVLTKDVHGPPVAFIPDMEFPEVEFDLMPGDRIFLYTDGLNEAKRQDGERFGIERMKEVLDLHKEDDNKTTLAAMKQAVDEFVGDEPQFDDMTMLGFTFKGRQ